MSDKRFGRRRKAAKRRSQAITALNVIANEGQNISINQLRAKVGELSDILELVLPEEKGNLLISPSDVDDLAKKVEEIPLSSVPIPDVIRSVRSTTKGDLEKLLKEVARVHQAVSQISEQAVKHKALLTTLSENMKLFNQLRRNKKRLLRCLETVSTQERTIEQILDDLDFDPIDHRELLRDVIGEDLGKDKSDLEMAKRAVRAIRVMSLDELPLLASKAFLTRQEFEDLKSGLAS